MMEMMGKYQQSRRGRGGAPVPQGIIVFQPIDFFAADQPVSAHNSTIMHDAVTGRREL
jgi:hypothetical protein